MEEKDEDEFKKYQQKGGTRNGNCRRRPLRDQPNPIPWAKIYTFTDWSDNYTQINLVSRFWADDTQMVLRMIFSATLDFTFSLDPDAAETEDARNLIEFMRICSL